MSELLALVIFKIANLNIENLFVASRYFNPIFRCATRNISFRLLNFPGNENLYCICSPCINILVFLTAEVRFIN